MEKSDSIYLQNKRGQVTIFIIIAVLVVAGVVLFFVLSGGEEEPSTPSDTQISSPEGYMKTCMEEDIERSVRELGLNGGDIDDAPKKNFQFNNEPERKISYLCYTPSLYKTCNIMEPALISHLEEKIKNRIEENSLVSNCWDSLKESYSGQGYEVNAQYSDFQTDLVRDKLLINLTEVDLILKKADETIQKDKLEFDYMTKLYNNAFVANEIAIYQSQYGQFDEMSYMELHPTYDIQWEPAQNNTKMYTVKNEEGDEKFRFAIKSLVPSKNI